MQIEKAGCYKKTLCIILVYGHISCIGKVDQRFQSTGVKYKRLLQRHIMKHSDTSLMQILNAFSPKRAKSVKIQDRFSDFDFSTWSQEWNHLWYIDRLINNCIENFVQFFFISYPGSIPSIVISFCFDSIMSWVNMALK